MERYSVLCPPIKSAHSEYRDQYGSGLWVYNTIVLIVNIEINGSGLWVYNTIVLSSGKIILN